MFKSILLLVLTITFSGLLQAQTLTITTGDFPPFCSKSFKFGGIVNGAAKEAFAMEGVKVDYVYTSWQRAYRMSEVGEVSGTLAWYDSEKRRKTHLYSDPIINDRIVWFHLKGYPLHWKSFEDLKNERIVAIRGYTYSDAFYNAIEDGTLDVAFVNRLKQSFDLILSGRKDVTLESVDVGYYMLRKLYPHSDILFTNHPVPAVSNPLHLLISKKTPNAEKIIETFNRGLAKLKEQGRIEELLLLARQGQLEQR
ncbi:substrate-binding periplasmic protein [Dongshaea marina]|uniref:substrate-binding periplasmic protein n=1 Tax=Dongshaea marina TaxID=2047966 RepID=UPI000D3E98DF|nr:transporter substrate-binding domain-containing protein [Dongshaea marina]